MAAPFPPSPNERLWERVADKSIALLVAMVILFAGFWYHKQAMEKLYGFVTERVLQRLERIEKCTCETGAK